MEEAEEKRVPAVERLAQMILAEAVCVAILLLAAVAVKYIFKDRAADFQDWYNRELCAETDINEVLSSEASDAF